MAYERRRWQRWVKRMRRRQKSCRSDCEPSEEGCSCCDSCRLPNIIRWAAPILRMVPHVASPGAARIGTSKNPSLFELNALCAVWPCSISIWDKFLLISCYIVMQRKFIFIPETCIKNYFLKRYYTSSFCIFVSRNFLLFEVYVENGIY